MRKHSGMRPHDIVVLLKILSEGQKEWLMKDLANDLKISASEISESIHRSVVSGLISGDKKSLNKLALLDFLKFGLHYVFPQQPGAIVRGIVTAHSAPPLNNQLMSKELYVWAHPKGKVRGQLIEPLHPKLPDVCLQNADFYEYMALIDAIRVGRVREQLLAIELLKQRIENVN